MYKLYQVTKVKDRSVAQALKDSMRKTKAQNEMQLTREIRSNKKCFYKASFQQFIVKMERLID